MYFSPISRNDESLDVFLPQFLDETMHLDVFLPQFLDETYASGCIFCHFSKKNYIYYIPLFVLHSWGQIWATEQASDVFYRKRRMWLMYLFSAYLIYFLFFVEFAKERGRRKQYPLVWYFTFRRSGAPAVKEEMWGLRFFYFWNARVVRLVSFHFWVGHCLRLNSAIALCSHVPYLARAWLLI
jgi:hypothetical protein